MLRCAFVERFSTFVPQGSKVYIVLFNVFCHISLFTISIESLHYITLHYITLHYIGTRRARAMRLVTRVARARVVALETADRRYAQNAADMDDTSMPLLRAPMASASALGEAAAPMLHTAQAAPVAGLIAAPRCMLLDTRSQILLQA